MTRPFPSARFHSVFTRTICVVASEFAFHTARRVAVTHWKLGKRYFTYATSALWRLDGQVMSRPVETSNSEHSTLLLWTDNRSAIPRPLARPSFHGKALEHSPHLGKLCEFVLPILAADKLRIDNNPLAIWSRIANIVRTVVNTRAAFYVSTAVHSL